jgi:hypothetical protein
MEELDTGPWCQFYDGPITNFVHQVITRDAYINNSLPQLDFAPAKYHYRKIYHEFNNRHWKHHWKKPTLFKTFDWTLEELQMNPIPKKKIVSLKND